MDLFRHKLTGNLLGLKVRQENNKTCATYYVLNEDGTHQESNAGFSTPNKTRKRVAVCLDKNVTRITK